MTKVRVLNDEGLQRFREYLTAARNGSTEPTPEHLLHDGLTSDPFSPDIEVELRTFDNAYDLGTYMVAALGACEARDISRNHGLWSWLALFYLNQIAPPDRSGRRKVLEESVYMIDGSFVFRRYYRHAIRAPWQSVRLHGEHAKILLISSGRGTRTEFAEQLGAYADLFGCTNVVSAAYHMWFDTQAQRPKRGSSGKGPGSPRRLATVVRQLQLTFDLVDCPLPEFLSLLPNEFDRWKPATEQLS